MRLRLLAALAAALLSTSIHAVAPTYSLGAHVVAAGTSVKSSGRCFRLVATIGERMTGYSASAGYSVSAGLRAQATGPADDIYFSGFEDCTP